MKKNWNILAMSLLLAAGLTACSGSAGTAADAQETVTAVSSQSEEKPAFTKTHKTQNAEQERQSTTAIRATL